MSASLVAMAQRSNAILEEQARYYRARAPEYDDWWYRRGEFAERPHRDEWFADVRALEAAFDDFAPSGDVLELAGGTGLWTARLAPAADALTVVDGSPEMIAINRERVGMRPQMRYVKADIFEWDPPAAAFEACFFGFWLSHVPDDRFAGFWATVARALRPGGRVLFVDSGPRSPNPVDPDTEPTVRKVADGRAFRVVKRYYDPAALEAELRRLGWDFTVTTTPNRFFIHGAGAAAEPV